MIVKLWNGEKVEGEFTISKGDTGIPPDRKIFKTILGSEYYLEQLLK